MTVAPNREEESFDLLLIRKQGVRISLQVWLQQQMGSLE